jgi:hypothetical protein
MGGLVQQTEASLGESGIHRCPMPWLPDSNKRASGKAGVVQEGGRYVVKIASLTSQLSFFSLVFLLPIRHLLSYFQGAQLLPVVRGLGLIPFLISMLLSLCFVKTKKRQVLWYGLAILVSLIVMAASIVFLSSNTQDYLGRSSLMFNLRILAYYVMYFFVGYYYEDFEQYKKWIFFFWFLMLLNLILHFDFSTMRVSFQGFAPDSVGMYLFLGDSFAIWSLLVLSLLTESPFKSTCVAICSVFALLTFVSRTSLYAFVLVLPLVILLTKKSLKYWIIFIVLFLLISPKFLELLAHTNRRMLAFLHLGSDQSMITRDFLFREGLLGLRKNWFLGDYAGQLRYGSLGSYIHNYLSLWRQFGLLPFLAFLSLLGFFVIKCWKLFWINIRRRKISPRAFFLIVAGGFCFIEIVTARSYTTPYIWFFLGMSLNSGICVPRTTKTKDLKIYMVKEESGKS